MSVLKKSCANFMEYVNKYVVETNEYFGKMQANALNTENPNPQSSGESSQPQSSGGMGERSHPQSAGGMGKRSQPQSSGAMGERSHPQQLSVMLLEKYEIVNTMHDFIEQLVSVRNAVTLDWFKNEIENGSMGDAIPNSPIAPEYAVPYSTASGRTTLIPLDVLNMDELDEIEIDMYRSVTVNALHCGCGADLCLKCYLCEDCEETCRNYEADCCECCEFCTCGKQPTMIGGISSNSETEETAETVETVETDETEKTDETAETVETVETEDTEKAEDTEKTVKTEQTEQIEKIEKIKKMEQTEHSDMDVIELDYNEAENCHHEICGCGAYYSTKYLGDECDNCGIYVCPECHGARQLKSANTAQKEECVESVVEYDSTVMDVLVEQEEKKEEKQKTLGERILQMMLALSISSDLINPDEFAKLTGVLPHVDNTSTVDSYNESDDSESDDGDSAEDSDEDGTEDDNAEDDNAEDDNAEDDNAEDDNAEDDNAEDDNAEDDNAEDDNAGDDGVGNDEFSDSYTSDDASDDTSNDTSSNESCDSPAPVQELAQVGTAEVVPVIKPVSLEQYNLPDIELD